MWMCLCVQNLAIYGTYHQLNDVILTSMAFVFYHILTWYCQVFHWVLEMAWELSKHLLSDRTVYQVILAVPKFGVIIVLNRRGYKLTQFRNLGINGSSHEWQSPLLTTAVDTQILFGGVYFGAIYDNTAKIKHPPK